MCFLRFAPNFASAVNRLPSRSSRWRPVCTTRQRSCWRLSVCWCQQGSPWQDRIDCAGAQRQGLAFGEQPGPGARQPKTKIDGKAKTQNRGLISRTRKAKQHLQAVEEAEEKERTRKGLVRNGTKTRAFWGHRAVAASLCRRSRRVHCAPTPAPTERRRYSSTAPPVLITPYLSAIRVSQHLLTAGEAQVQSGGMARSVRL